MSRKLVSRNSDLSRLQAEGLDLVIGKSKHLLVRDVPYVNAAKQVKRGVIVSALDLAGEKTVPPETHVVFFVGEPPCDEYGSLIPGVSPHSNQSLGEGLSPNHQISRVPKTGSSPGKYTDYYQKIKALLEIICHPAKEIDPSATPYTNPVVVPDQEDDSVFNYIDTAATKAGIVLANTKLESQGNIGIVGVGGTGAYILDLVAKTPVPEIHLFDGDDFLNHNAFRCPGAASLEDLTKKEKKVQYLSALYGKMRKKIVPHDCYINRDTVDLLKNMSFVFICIDKGVGKKLIVEILEEWGIPFVDVGMGIQLGEDNTLGGVLTVTASTPNKRDHFRGRTAFSDGESANEYSNNVQISEINALNASLAVIKWKKILGYYDDVRKEHWCAYTIRTNTLISEDSHEA